MKKQVNLLVIEDNPADADLIREYLSEVAEFDANLTCVRTLEEGKKHLANNTVHAVLVDLSLPDSRGVETVRQVVDNFESATAIVLTSFDDKRTALDAIESGAQDYLLKDAIDPEVLSRVIRFSLQRTKWHSKINDVQIQLYQAQKMDSIGRLAGGIAHDFNNQLGVITLLCSMIKNELEENHSVQQYVDQINTVTKRTASLTKRLLAFSRIQPIEAKVTGLNEIIRESESLFGSLLGENIKLETELDKEAYICVDPGLMGQVLMNLALNAKDAMPNGGTIRFATETVAAEDADGLGHVLLKVSDTGTGIPKEILDKIFDPFFTTKEVGKGTGLGLSMVLGTVKQSGGDIRVQSQPGRGTTFILSFPRVENDKKKAAPTTKKSPDSHEHISILVVDDEAMLRNIMQKILQSHKYVVEVANDGQEALQKIHEAEKAFDLLITDMNMPKMGGRELVEEARKKIPCLKVLFTSGYMTEASDELLDIKGVKYLPKPASVNQLLGKIQETLNEA